MLNFSLLSFIAAVTFQRVSCDFFSRDGDIVIGFVLPVHEVDIGNAGSQNIPNPYAKCSGPLIPSRALMVTHFRRLIDDINGNVSILGGFKLGYQIVDSCSLPSTAAAQAAKWMGSKVEMASQNFSASGSSGTTIRPMPFVLGGFMERVTAVLATMLQEIDIPLIDFGSTSPALSDRTAYRFFARTSPSDKNQASAIASLMFNYLWWNCTHLIYSEGSYGETGAQALRDELTRFGVCRATDVKAPVARKNDPAGVRKMSEILGQIASKSPTSQVIICFCEEETLLNLLIALREFKSSQQNRRNLRFVVIAGDTWGTSLPLDNVQSPADGSITLKIAYRDVPGYREWVSANFQALLDNIDPWLDEFVQDKFGISHDQIPKKRSSLKLDANSVPMDDSLDLMANALYAGIHALRLLLEEACPPGKTLLSQRCASNYIRHTYNGRRLYALLPNASRYIGNNFQFTNNLDGQPFYTFYRYSSKTNSYNDFAFWNPGDGLAPYGSFALSVRNWPDTNQPIYATCPPSQNDTSATTLGPGFNTQVCPSVFYSQTGQKAPDNTSLNVACAYYCRETRVTPICSQQGTTRIATTLAPIATTVAPTDGKDWILITGLAAGLAVAGFLLFVCLGLLIYAVCKCCSYKKKLEDAQTNFVEISGFPPANSAPQRGRSNPVYAVNPGYTSGQNTYDNSILSQTDSTYAPNTAYGVPPAGVPDAR